MLSEYLIDRHRVIYDTGIGWHCECAEFLKLHDCRHSRESAGRLAAQHRIRTRTKNPIGTLEMFSNKPAPDTPT